VYIRICGTNYTVFNKINDRFSAGCQVNRPCFWSHGFFFVVISRLEAVNILRRTLKKTILLFFYDRAEVLFLCCSYRNSTLTNVKHSFPH
jgi:hypothetical protein